MFNKNGGLPNLARGPTRSGIVPQWFWNKVNRNPHQEQRPPYSGWLFATIPLKIRGPVRPCYGCKVLLLLTTGDIDQRSIAFPLSFSWYFFFFYCKQIFQLLQPGLYSIPVLCESSVPNGLGRN